MHTTPDNGGPPPEQTLHDFGATPVWVWNDGQVGGPFTFREVAQLEADRGRVPGMLGRVEGGEWMPWPDLEKWMVAQTASRPPAPPAEVTDRRFVAMWGIGGGLICLFVWACLQTEQAFRSLAVLAALFVVPAIYFAPWAVAQQRGHPQTLAIGVLNLFGGWTLLGWIVALVWACTSVPQREQPKGF